MSAKCEQLFQKCYHNQWVSHEEKATFLRNCNARQPRTPGIQPPAPTSFLSMSDDDASYQQCRSYIGKVIHREALPIRAFWTTTPFQLMGTAQQLGRDLDNVAQSPLVAPILGATAFLGLAVAAASQLRLGNTAPLQRFIEAL